MATFEIIRSCALALLSGTVLQTAGVSAGNGIVIDWRTVTSGETLQTDGDAFDTAQLFVALVGVDAASAVLAVELPAEVAEYARNHAGARRRSFTAGPFTVMVEPHNDDDRTQAEFTRRLAEAARGLL